MFIMRGFDRMFDSKKILLCALLMFARQVSGECDSGCPRYFAILGVVSGATKQHVKEEWLKKIKKLHPDKNPDCADCDARTKELNEAYDAVNSDKCRCEDFASSGEPNHKDGCRYEGQSCKCSNTDWSGECQYQGISLVCTCEKPKTRSQNLDGCKMWGEPCTCSDTGWSGICGYADDLFSLRCMLCKKPEPQHKDGCRNWFDECTCSDTGWKGSCVYDDNSDLFSHRLHCKCEKPKPQHKDGCSYEGGLCTCSNTGWHGTCRYQGNDYLSCTCEAPKPQHLDGCKNWAEQCTCADTGWKGTCVWKFLSDVLHCDCPFPPTTYETIKVTVEAEGETDEVHW